MEYATKRLGFSTQDIIISGRSIGSAPACYLASEYDIKLLLLISPVKTISKQAWDKYGSLASMFISDQFDNEKFL